LIRLGVWNKPSFTADGAEEAHRTAPKIASVKFSYVLCTYLGRRADVGPGAAVIGIVGTTGVLTAAEVGGPAKT
jgi:hypothetical protein